MRTLGNDPAVMCIKKKRPGLETSGGTRNAIVRAHFRVLRNATNVKKG